MATNDFKSTTDRRRFLASLASGAAAISLATIPSVNLHAENNFISADDDDPELLFRNLKGKHRAIFDVTEPNQENPMMPFAWARVFLLTNEATGTPTKQNDVVIVLRHAGIGYAFEDRLWAKYGLGELFNAHDPETKKPANKNNFWKPAKPFEVPGIGPVPIAINDLQDSGVHFVVCNVAMTVYSAILAGKMNMKKEDIYSDLKSGLLPGVMIVPSGVWAVGRAQENKCAYFFAG
jgi:intracellular sulfur oxidation DsrE/DsrF family protein